MHNEDKKQEREKSTTETLGTHVKDDTPSNDLTSNDGSEDPGSELDKISDYIHENELKKGHTKPQADETLNPGLNSENDI